MSSNVYEDPNLMMNVRYSKGVREDRGESVERRVDIYESADTFIDHRVDLYAQDGGAHTQKHLPAVQRNPFRAAALVLGLLCLLLVVAVTVLSKIYISVVVENRQLNNSSNGYKTRYEELKTNYQQLENDYDNQYCQLKDGESHTQGNVTRWKRFRCSCYYISTERKNWADSRKDCQAKGADLVIINSKEENEFVSKLNEHGASWIGLSVKTRKDWVEEVEWKWVDGSTPTYLAWGKEVSVMETVDGYTAYIDLQRTWNYTNNGYKQWICKKQMQ